MKVKATDTFFDSLEKIMDATKFWKLQFWKDKYYELKWIIWSIKNYYKIVPDMRPWDYSCVLLMLKHQIKILSDYIEKYGIEIEKDRLPRVEKMKRFIELANNHLEDNYFDRCRFIHKDFVFEPIEGDDNLTEIKLNETEEEEKHNLKAMKGAHKLQEKEWNEMFEILKEMRGWWD